MRLQLQKFDVLESTNKSAVLAAQHGALEGTVIVAKKQYGGHGRIGRIWNSPEGGLWFSIILRPKIEPQYVAQLTLLAGVAVTQALRSLYETDEIFIKWPNDILINGQKICGILSEMSLNEIGQVDYAVIGIGINVSLKENDFPSELRTTATSLNLATAKNHDCNKVLQYVLHEIESIYQEWLNTGMKSVIELWRHFNCTLGKKINVKDCDKIIYSGTAIAVDEYGALIVQDSSGNLKSFDFGEISIRPVD